MNKFLKKGLLCHYSEDKLIECGCDEAGRGALAGPVFAAAVILPNDYLNQDINDSKQLNPNFPLEPSRRNVKLKANRFIPKFSNPCSSIHLKSHFHDYFVRVLFNICWNSKHFIAYCR